MLTDTAVSKTIRAASWRHVLVRSVRRRDINRKGPEFINRYTKDARRRYGDNNYYGL